ncbi:MAG: tetratricopeptide repeat protein [Anaerolineae bacterium]|nr:tetratricopeptide repeat protein [Anaerolineae bacterium]
MVAIAVVQGAQYRLANHYLDKLRTIRGALRLGNDNITFALNLFDKEWSQIKHWLAWCSQRASDDPQAARITLSYLSSATDILEMRLTPQERAQMMETGLQIARHFGDQPAEINMLNALAAAQLDLQLLDQAEEYLQQSLALAQQFQHESDIAHALGRIALVEMNRHNLDQAYDYLQQSLVRFQSLDDQHSIGNTLNNLSILERDRGNLPAARDLGGQSLAIRQRMGNFLGVAHSYYTLGVTAEAQGDLAAARDYLERSVSTYRTANLKQRLSNALNALGNVIDLQGDHDGARVNYEEALALLRELGDQVATANVLGNLSFIASANEDYVTAERYLQDALVLFKATNQRVGLVFSFANLIPICLKLGQIEKAKIALHEGLEMSISMPRGPFQSTMIVGAVQLWTHQGDFEPAVEWASVVLNHPAALHENRTDVEKLRPQWEAAREPAQIEAALERGKSLEAANVITDILKQL